MSVRKLTANIFMALAMLGGFASVQAQENVPIADPFAFDPDFRWFEPVTNLDLSDMKLIKRVNTGWFATYDRLHMYGSRPELTDPSAIDNFMDSGWGHRYEVGYMMPDTHNGWTFTFTDMGVGEIFTVNRERVNRVNDDQLTGDPDLPGPPFGFGVPESDNNTPGLNTRTAFIQDSDNVFNYKNYEVSKTWRTLPRRYGGIIEPMVGMRWTRVSDINTRQTFNSSLDIDTVPFDIFGDAEQLVTDLTITDNEIFAGHAGFRYTFYRERFVFSTDVRVFAGGSIQSSKSTRSTEITIYDGTGIGADVDNIIYRQTAPVYDDNEEFSLGFDIRGDVSYQLTKALSIRTGVQIIDVASGVWRGGPRVNSLFDGDQDQDLFMIGGLFGLTLNR